MSDVNTLLQPFQPVVGPNASTIALSATTASSAVALPTANPPGTYGASGANPSAAAVALQFAIWNAGSTFAFVAFGGSSVAATVPTTQAAGSFPVSPGAGYNGPPATITVSGNPGYVAAIMASSTATLYICPGNGAGA